MLTADGEKSKSPKRAKVRFLLATLTYIYIYIYRRGRSETCQCGARSGSPQLWYEYIYGEAMNAIEDRRWAGE